MSELNSFIVAGRGEANAFERDLFEARIRNTIRYADPAAWITATAVARALAGAGEILAQWRHEIGVIAISDSGPGGTMAQVEEAGTKGYSSPLHYAAAGPWTLVGVSCIAFGLRGPTICLTMEPRDGLALAMTMCDGWLTRKAARLMVVASCRTVSSSTMLSRAVLLAPVGLLDSGAPLSGPVLSWMVGDDPAEGAGA